MKEQIFQFVNEYAVWGILIAVLLTFFMLCRMNRQLKKLNRSLSGMAGKIQDYFTVIMEEEPLETPPAAAKEAEHTEDLPKREIYERKNTRQEDEAVIHAVLKEYLS